MTATAMPDIAKRHPEQAARLIAEGNKGLTEKRQYAKRFEELKRLRRTIEPTFRQVRDYLLPSCGRWLDGDGENEDERPGRRASFIFDSSATKMALIAAEGLHGGLTDQAEQWFSYYVGNYQDYKTGFSEEAKNYIISAQECTRDTLAISNFYTAIFSFYLELFGFGTAVMLVLADPLTRCRYFAKTAGSYWIDQDKDQRVDTLYLRHSMRACDIVKEYGKDKCPDRIIDAMRNGNGNASFSVIQCIQPWNSFGNAPASRDFTFEDVRYIEGGDDTEKILYRGGYRTRPFVAARWSDIGDSLYGRSCPGIDALPDVKQLQTMVVDYNMANKWKADPAFVTSSVNDYDSILPGHIYKVEGNVRDNLLTPLVTAEYDIPAQNDAMDRLRERIGAIMYNTEFRMVQSRKRQITATEVQELRSEKLSALGPVVARIGDNALIPCLDRTYEIIAFEWNMLTEPPEEIAGLDIKPYFTGQLAKAQRQAGILGDANQLLNIVTVAYPLDPQIAQSVDFDALLRRLDDVDAFPSGVLRSQDEMEAMRAQAAQQQQQAQQAAGMAAATDMAQKLGNTKVTPDTAAGQLLGGEAMQ